MDYLLDRNAITIYCCSTRTQPSSRLTRPGRTSSLEHRSSGLTSFSTSSRRAPSGPGSAPPPKDGPCPPLRSRSRRRPLAWRARAKWCRPETTSLVINERHPVALDGRLPEAGGSRGLPTDPGPGAPHRPASNHGKCGPARHASRASRFASEHARPLTRTDPNLTAAAIGAIRGYCPRLDTQPSIVAEAGRARSGT
jgi:hypothetical protein